MKLKKQGLSTGSITGLLVSVIMMVVFFNIAASLIPEGATAVHNLSDTLTGDADVLGTAPAAFAANIDTYTGWLWVAGPLVLAVGLVVSMFFKRGRR